MTTCGLHASHVLAEEQTAPPLTLGIASSYVPLAEAMVERWHQSGADMGEAKALLSAASSGTLSQQTLAGAPRDLLVLADEALAQHLYETLPLPNPPTLAGCAQLALVQLKSHVRRKDSTKKLGIANPELAPAGRLALRWLQSAPQWQHLPRYQARNAAATLWLLHARLVDSVLVPLPLVQALTDLPEKEEDWNIQPLPGWNLRYWAVALTDAGAKHLPTLATSVATLASSAGYQPKCTSQEDTL